MAEVAIGAFTERHISPNKFSLGGDIFISSSTYKNHILVQIRKYVKYGIKYYPSKEGVSLTPYQYANLVSNDYVCKDNTLYFVCNDIFPTLNGVNVHPSASAGIQDQQSCVVSIQFTDGVILKKGKIASSGQTFTQSVALNNEQWNEVFGLRKVVMDSVCNLTYQKVSTSIKARFETISGCPTLGAVLEDKEIMRELSFLLWKALY